MKRLLFFFCLAMNMLTQTSAQGNIAINSGNFPDQKFREYLLAQSYGADGILTTEEINGITEIDAYGIDISSLKGIEYFTALTTLDCADDQLTSLDVSKNMALTTLYCGNNKLTSLDVSTNTALTTLDWPRPRDGWCMHGMVVFGRNTPASVRASRMWSRQNPEQCTPTLWTVASSADSPRRRASISATAGKSS